MRDLATSFIVCLVVAALLSLCAYLAGFSIEASVPVIACTVIAVYVGGRIDDGAEGTIGAFALGGTVFILLATATNIGVNREAEKVVAENKVECACPPEVECRYPTNEP